jgi:hypothetical protein
MSTRNHASGRPQSTGQPADVSDTSLGLPDDAPDRMELLLMRLTKSITDSFNVCISNLVQAFEEKFNVKADAQGNDIFGLSTKISQLEKRVDDLTSANHALSSNVQLQQEKQQLAQAVDGLEQHSRADSLLIHGMPLPQLGTTEDLYSDIPRMINSLIPSVQLTPEMISVTHRLPSSMQPSTSLQRPTRPPPIVIRFTRRLTRTTLMANRKQLKGKPIVISEHLSPFRSALLKKANSLVSAHKLTAAWSQDGKILVKSLSNRTIQILSDDDFSQF